MNSGLGGPLIVVVGPAAVNIIIGPHRQLLGSRTGLTVYTLVWIGLWCFFKCKKIFSTGSTTVYSQPTFRLHSIPLVSTENLQSGKAYRTTRRQPSPVRDLTDRELVCQRVVLLPRESLEPFSVGAGMAFPGVL